MPLSILSLLGTTGTAPSATHVTDNAAVKSAVRSAGEPQQNDALFANFMRRKADEAAKPASRAATPRNDDSSSAAGSPAASSGNDEAMHAAEGADASQSASDQSSDQRDRESHSAEPCEHGTEPHDEAVHSTDATSDARSDDTVDVPSEWRDAAEAGEHAAEEAAAAGFLPPPLWAQPALPSGAFDAALSAEPAPLAPAPEWSLAASILPPANDDAPSSLDTSAQPFADALASAVPSAAVANMPATDAVEGGVAITTAPAGTQAAVPEAHTSTATTVDAEIMAALTPTASTTEIAAPQTVSDRDETTSEDAADAVTSAEVSARTPQPMASTLRRMAKQERRVDGAELSVATASAKMADNPPIASAPTNPAPAPADATLAVSSAATLTGALAATTAGVQNTGASGLRFEAVATAQTAETAQPSVGGQIVAHIAALPKKHSTVFALQLSPEHLGKVDVVLDMRKDGQVHVAIQAATQDALELLQRDSRQLERSLQELGFKTESGNLNFSLRQDGQGAGSFAQQFGQGQQNNQGHNGAEGRAGEAANGRYGTQLANQETPTIAQHYRVVSQDGLDIRV